MPNTKTSNIENFATYLQSLSKDLHESGYIDTAVDVHAASSIIRELLDILIRNDVDLSKLEFQTLLPF